MMKNLVMNLQKHLTISVQEINYQFASYNEIENLIKNQGEKLGLYSCNTTGKQSRSG